MCQESERKTRGRRKHEDGLSDVEGEPAEDVEGECAVRLPMGVVAHKNPFPVTAERIAKCLAFAPASEAGSVEGFGFFLFLKLSSLHCFAFSFNNSLQVNSMPEEPVEHPEGGKQDKEEPPFLVFFTALQRQTL